MQRTRILGLVVGIALALSLPGHAYTVYLQDGSRLIAKEPPEIRGEIAIITLQSGTVSSISASEIDVARTREANQSELGSAMVLEGGEFTDRPVEQTPKKEKRLSDIMRKNRPTGESPGAGPSKSSARGSSGSSTEQPADLLDWQRSRYRDLDIASEIQGIFRGQGVEGARLYQGTKGDRILVDLNTDSEASVFRGIRVAATALTQIQSRFPGKIDALELVLMTSSRDRAGQFLIDAGTASQLANGDTELPAFYVENVRF